MLDASILLGPFVSYRSYCILTNVRRYSAQVWYVLLRDQMNKEHTPDTVRARWSLTSFSMGVTPLKRANKLDGKERCWIDDRDSRPCTIRPFGIFFHCLSDHARCAWASSWWFLLSICQRVVCVPSLETADFLSTLRNFHVRGFNTPYCLLLFVFRLFTHLCLGHSYTAFEVAYERFASECLVAG